MAIERTLAIIKPDAVGRGLTGEILSRIHAAKFHIIAIKTRRLTRKEAEGFYAVHRERPFFDELTTFMSTSKVVVMVLEARKRNCQMARYHGRHRSSESRSRHYPQRTGSQHSIQLHARFGRAGHSRLRNQLFLLRLGVSVGISNQRNLSPNGLAARLRRSLRDRNRFRRRFRLQSV